MDEETLENSSRALINVDDLFRRRFLEETSLADLAINALEPYFDELPEKSRVFAFGNAVSKGGKYSGSIRATGNFHTKGVTVVDKLTTAGNTSAKELLVVRKNSTVAGNIKLKSNAVFAGKTRLAGTVTVEENIISSQSLSLAGTVRIGKQVITDGNISLSGNISINQLQSLSSVTARGTLNIDNDVRSKRFQMTMGKGNIGGDLIAKDVGIGHNKHLKRYLTNFESDRNLANPIQLAKFIGKLIISPFTRKKSSDPLEIQGDIIAHEVFLENVIIHGDINSKRITIGDNVEIAGNVEYSEYLEILTERDYKSKKIEAEDLLYIDLEETLKLDTKRDVPANSE